jgi:hypothetical protein
VANRDGWQIAEVQHRRGIARGIGPAAHGCAVTRERASAWWLVVLLGACRSGGEDIDDESTGETGDASTSEPGSDGTSDDAPDPDSTDDGGTPLGPIACDPRADECAPQRCAGAPIGGFWCRPPCSSMAMEGTECSEGLCLPAGGEPEPLACFGVRECDPITDEGCGDDESCVVVDLSPVRVACVPRGDGALGDACGPAGAHACAPGSACLGASLDDDGAGVCTAWCEPGSASSAECPACVAVSDTLGACGECDVLDDGCEAGTHCQPVNEVLAGECQPDGTGLPGMPCDPTGAGAGCIAGLVCIELLPDTHACIQPCDPGGPACTDPDASCVDVAALDPAAPVDQLGVCLATGAVTCDPLDAPAGCDDGLVCLVVAPGVGLCGADCDPTAGDEACEGNAACLPEADGEVDVAPFIAGNGACGAACMLDDDCTTGTCLLLAGLDAAGVCSEGGETPCDPSMPASCTDPDALACVATDDGTSGVCLPSCFVQDPAACGDPTACHGKTDPEWHSGVCFGQEPACDPIAQDCLGAQSCVIIGGTAIGGHAFVCSGAGAVAEGGDCTDDAATCAAGLVCTADVCRVPCDPAAEACDTGTCTDVGAAFYLPADTVGVCM